MKYYPNKTILIICFLLLYSVKTFAQKQTIDTLKIKVTDEKSFPVENGAVYVLSPKDSSVLNSYSWSKGAIKISGLPQKFLLKITSLGYEPYYSPTFGVGTEPIPDLGSIVLKVKDVNLNAVVIVGKQSIISSNAGNTKIEVANSSLSSSSTIEELFSKMPMISLGTQYASVVGKGEAIIYYNGDKISVDQLKSIPVERIKQIEILTNPSSKYDAQGNAVINITGKSKLSEGFQGELRQITQMGRYFNETTNLSLDYKNQNLSLSGGYTQNTFNRNVNLLSNYEANTGSVSYNGTSNSNTLVKSNYIPTYRFGIAYDFDKKNTISVEYRGSNTVERQTFDNSNHTFSPTPGLNDTSLTTNAGHTQWYNNSVSLNYSRKLDTMGSALTFAGQYFNEKEYDNFDIHQITGENNITDFTNNSRDSVKIYSLRVDLNKVFKNGDELSFGLKYSGTDMSYGENFNQIDSGRTQLVPQYSSNYRFKENIEAAYVQYKGKINTWNYLIGTRMEYTHSNGFSYLQNTTLIDTSYVSFFPNFHLSKKIKDVEYGLDYSSRILRPSYDDLSPFVTYNGPQNLSVGSPSLTPAFTNSVSAYFQYKDYTVKVGYSNTKGDINTVVQYEDNGQAILQKVNIAHHRIFFIDLSVPFHIGPWNSDNDINLSYNSLSDNRYLNSSYGHLPLLYVYSYNTIAIGKIFNIDAIFNYSSTQTNGLARTGDQLYAEAGISQKYLNKKLSIRISGQDIFNSYALKKSLSYNGNLYAVDRSVTLQSIKLSVVYRFGKIKKLSYTNNSAAEDETDRTH